MDEEKERSTGIRRSTSNLSLGTGVRRRSRSSSRPSGEAADAEVEDAEEWVAGPCREALLAPAAGLGGGGAGRGHGRDRIERMPGIAISYRTGVTGIKLKGRWDLFTGMCLQINSTKQVLT